MRVSDTPFYSLYQLTISLNNRAWEVSKIYMLISVVLWPFGNTAIILLKTRFLAVSCCKALSFTFVGCLAEEILVSSPIRFVIAYSVVAHFNLLLLFLFQSSFLLAVINVF